ncbi:hypothetical protein OAV88_03525 [bacterium]|nr:hypothetical protein [bacterium]
MLYVDTVSSTRKKLWSGGDRWSSGAWGLSPLSLSLSERSTEEDCI